MKRIFKYVLYAVLSTMLAVFMLEIGLRSLQGWFFEAPDHKEYDKEIGTILRPSFKQTVGIGMHRNTIQHNSLGLRGPEVREDKPDLRIFLIGDSYTYGWGTDNTGTIASQLQDYLKRNMYDAEVLNLGVGAYSTIQSYLLFRRLSYLKPDIVIYMFCDNDPQDNKNFVERKSHPHKPEYYRFLPRVLLRRYSILIQSIIQRKIFLDRWPEARDIFQKGKKELDKRTKDLESKRLTIDYTNKIAELCDKIGAQFFISFINFRVNESGKVSLTPLASAYRQFFAEQGHETISATDKIEKYVENWEKFRGDVPFIQHFSEYGYKPYAEELGQKILDKFKNKKKD